MIYSGRGVVVNFLMKGDPFSKKKGKETKRVGVPNYQRGTEVHMKVTGR